MRCPFPELRRPAEISVEVSVSDRFRSVERRSSNASSLVSRFFLGTRMRTHAIPFFFLLPRQVLEVAPEPSGLAHKQRGGHRLSPCPPIPLPQHLCAARHPGVRGQVHGPRRSNSAKTQKQLWLFFAELFYSLSGNPEPRDPPSLSLLRYLPGLEAVPWRLSNCEIA